MKLFEKCTKCSRKQYMPYKCDCGMVYCSKHRMPEKHECKDLIDSIKRYKKKLTFQMIAIKPKKLNKI